MITIREFIELQMVLYRLDLTNSKTFNKIKVKVSRELQKINNWKNRNEKKAIGKTTANLLDDATRRQLEVAMKPYFLKLANINHDDYTREKQRNSKRARNIANDYYINPTAEDEAYFYEVPKSEQLFVMIEALFNEKFELDKKSWNEDYTNYQLFINDEEALASDNLALSNIRLQYPIKYYVKKR